MAQNKKQNYLHGAAILTAGVLIVKVLGAVFKIPLGGVNLLGDEGYAHFTSAYNIYTLFLTFATAGFPVALSRMIAEADARHETARVGHIFRVALWFLAAMGAVSCGAMLLFPRALANFLGDPDAALGIAVLGPTALMVCLMSVYRGFCQGHGDMRPTTVSQVLEVAVKVPLGLLLAWLLVRAGRGLAVSSAGAILGVAAGSAAALAYLAIHVRREYFGKDEESKPLTGDPGKSKELFAELVRVGIPITLGSCVLAILNLVDNGQALNGLHRAGFSVVEASVLYGIYGKVQTLYMLPTYFMQPFQSSVVPAISSALAAEKEHEAGAIAESALRTATTVVLPMCVGLGVMAYPIVNVLWPGSSEAGPGILTILSAGSFFVCMTMLTNSLLQATGHERLPMWGMACGTAVKVLLNVLLIRNPAVNIHGAAWSSVAGFAVMSGMNYLFLCKYTKERPRLKNFLVRPLLSSAVMGAAAWALYALLSALLPASRMGLLLALAAVVAVAVVVYLVMVILTRAVRADDLRLLPKGEKLAALLHLR